MATSPLIQLLGVSDEPIVLTAAQLHGDRTRLLQHPDTVRLDIRPLKRSRGGGGKGGGGAAAAAAPDWRLHTGRQQIPESLTPTPTLFREDVYSHLGHALFAFLLWTLGGATGDYHHRIYPEGPDVFPHLVVEEGERLLLSSIDDDDAGTTTTSTAAIAVHILPHDPTPQGLAALMWQAEEWWRHQQTEAGQQQQQRVLLVLGPIRPPVGGGGGGRATSSTTAPTTTTPSAAAAASDLTATPMRGIVVTLPHMEVSHGWYACEDAGRLCFAFQGQSGGGGRLLSPARLPPFSSVGYRLWRKGQATFAIVPAGDPNGDAWDVCIRRFLQGS